MAQIEFSKEQLEQEKFRRSQEKCDRLQTEMSPFSERGLWKFCQHIAPDFYTDAKQPLIDLCEIFQKVTKGELRKVLISFAPRMGKSRTTSLWIAWWLGYEPDGSFMRNCYSDGLAMDLSKAVIDILLIDRYQEVFPHVKLDPKASSKLGWQLDNTTIKTYFGAGIAGTITGRGCNKAAILDDPIKNPDEAMSEAFLDKLELFLETVHNTRIDANSNCAEVIIQTRWCEKDPIGMRENDPTWTQFIFPVLGDDNKSVCEAMFPTERILEIKESWERKNLGWMFQALYMCQPADKKFAKLSLDSLKRFRMADLQALGEPDDVVGFCDYANKGSDNLSSPFAHIHGHRKFIVGVVFSNEDSVQLEKPLVKKIAYFKPNEYVFESNQGGIEFATNLQRNYQKIFDALDLEIDCRSTSTNKEIRIMLRLGEIKNDCYFLADDEQDEDYARFMSNLANYGKYKYGKDDAPDSLAGLLSIVSDVGDIDIDYFGDDKDITHKILDTKGKADTDDSDDDNESSEIMFF